MAVHSDTSINPHDGVQVSRMLHAFLGWAVRVYSQPSPIIAPFDDGLIPRPAAAAPADRTAEQLQKLQEQLATYGTDPPLGKLVREIVGLDRSAAQEAFAELVTRGSLTADQITFMNQIVDHLVHNGTMDPNLLFGPPFTDFHDSGIVGVLPRDAQAIVRTIQTINNNALVA